MVLSLLLGSSYNSNYCYKDSPNASARGPSVQPGNRRTFVVEPLHKAFLRPARLDMHQRDLSFPI